MQIGSLDTLVFQPHSVDRFSAWIYWVCPPWVKDNSFYKKTKHIANI